MAKNAAEGKKVLQKTFVFQELSTPTVHLFLSNHLGSADIDASAPRQLVRAAQLTLKAGSVGVMPQRFRCFSQGPRVALRCGFPNISLSLTAQFSHLLQQFYPSPALCEFLLYFTPTSTPVSEIVSFPVFPIKVSCHFTFPLVL